MRIKLVCSRCGKPLTNHKGVYVRGLVFGPECAKEILRLLDLRASNQELISLCSGVICTKCKKTFMCPVESVISSGMYQQDLPL